MTHAIVFEFLNQPLLVPPPWLLAQRYPKHMWCPEEESCWRSIPQSPFAKYFTKRRTATAASVTPSSSAIAATSCRLPWLRPCRWVAGVPLHQLGTAAGTSAHGLPPSISLAKHLTSCQWRHAHRCDPIIPRQPTQGAGHKRIAAGCKRTYFDSHPSCDTRPGQAIVSNLSARFIQYQ